MDTALIQFVSADGSIVQVMLSGPNQVSPESGFDTDDIYSEIPASLMASFVLGGCELNYTRRLELH